MKKMDNRTAAVETVRKLREAGHEAYFVGGAVRDMLLERVSAKEEYDVATSASAQQVMSLFKKTREVGAKFGVILVGLGGQWIEVASFRTEKSYTDGRHPDQVSPGTLEEDAQRRDFTVNGLYYDPETGELIDRVNGQADLSNRLIRAIGAPDERFREDHLRMLRAVRFAGQLEGFEIEETTANAIKRFAGQIVHISAERILEELRKLLASRHRVKGLILADELGLMRYILPEVHSLHSVSAPSFTDGFTGDGPEKDAFDQTMAVMDRLPEGTPFEVAMAGLLHLTGYALETALGAPLKIRSRPDPREWNASARIAGEVARQLTCSNKERMQIVWLVQTLPLFGRAEELTLAQIKRLMLYGRLEGLLQLYRARVEAGLEPHKNLTAVETLAEKVKPETLSNPPLISGEDLTESLGLQPGPIYQNILDDVYDAQLNEEIHTKQEALELAKRIIPPPSPE